jgi:hypothetical protein
LESFAAINAYTVSYIAKCIKTNPVRFAETRVFTVSRAAYSSESAVSSAEALAKEEASSRRRIVHPSIIVADHTRILPLSEYDVKEMIARQFESTLVACRRDNVTADAAGRIGISPLDLPELLHDAADSG